MSFFSVISADEISKGSKPMDLNVIQDNGIGVTPDLKIIVNDLNEGNKQFLNNGYGGISFKINVIINKNDMFGNTPVLEKLHQWITTMTPLYVVTEAIDIKNDRYIISKNSDRKQTYRNNTVWSWSLFNLRELTLLNIKIIILMLIKPRKIMQRQKRKQKPVKNQRRTLRTRIN